MGSMITRSGRQLWLLLVSLLPLFFSLGAGMVSVPAGEFVSGCNQTLDSDCEKDEKKPREARHLAAFVIDRTEVSVADYQKCVVAGACTRDGLQLPFWKRKLRPEWSAWCNWEKPGREYHPINCLDYDQAAAYCGWAGKRLPTDWEWEKAARGSDQRLYPWGNGGYAGRHEGGPEGAEAVANIPDRTASEVHDWKVFEEDYEDGYRTTSPVGAFPAGASPYGALDMAGNVWEWVSDDEQDMRRMARGGSYRVRPYYTRTSNQHRVHPNGRTVDFGFRCARSGPLLEGDRAPRLRALVLEGQPTRRPWLLRTRYLRRFLLETGLFDVDVVSTGPEGPGPDFRPDFAEYDVVVSNYRGADWPLETQQDFVRYVQQGGGLVLVHAAITSFGSWKEFNDISGLAGWSDRSDTEGVYLYYDDRGNLVRDGSAGRAGHHSDEHATLVVLRNAQHPITQGLPARFMHTPDEIYDRLRGPGVGVEILATTWSSKHEKGSGRHEPVLFEIAYGEGRVINLTLGHGVQALEAVGFQVLFQRSSEWAATGAVTQPVPLDMPDVEQATVRPLPR